MAASVANATALGDDPDKLVVRGLSAITFGWAVPGVFGVPGNIMALAVACRRNNRKLSPCVYMAAMAVMDTILLLEEVWIITLMRLYDRDLMHPREFFMRLHIYVLYTSGMLSGLYLAGMSVDRLIAVRLPMKAAQLCTASRAKLVIALCSVFVITLNVHVFFIVHYLRDDQLGIHAIAIRGEPIWELLATGFQVMVGTIIPFIIILGSNLLIILALRKASKERSKLGSRQPEKDTHLTRMLLFVSFAYVILTLPYRMYHLVLRIPALARLYNMTNVYWRMRYVIQGWAIHNLFIFNYAVNFFLYCIGGGQKYRNDAREVIRGIFPCCFSGSKLTPLQHNVR